jgi:hypothetical protein
MEKVTLCQVSSEGLKPVTAETQTDISHLFLKFEDGSYVRFEATKDGLLFTLINGTDAKIITSDGYPAVLITKAH